jgi:hypothetical protein
MKRIVPFVMKKLFLAAFLAAGLVPAPEAQTALPSEAPPAWDNAGPAEKIDLLLARSAVSYGEAASLVLEAAGLFSGPGEEAFARALKQKWLPVNVSFAGAARTDGVSLLIMGAFDIRGGFMFRLTRGKRYAYREMVYKELIRGRSDPGFTVSGEELLQMVGAALRAREKSQNPAGGGVQ